MSTVITHIHTALITGHTYKHMWLQGERKMRRVWKEGRRAWEGGRGGRGKEALCTHMLLSAVSSLYFVLSSCQHWENWPDSFYWHWSLFALLEKTFKLSEEQVISRLLESLYVNFGKLKLLPQSHHSVRHHRDFTFPLFCNAPLLLALLKDDSGSGFYFGTIGHPHYWLQ